MAGRYENVDHFAKLFMRHVGMLPPNDYRKQFKIVWLSRRICCQIPDGEIYSFIRPDAVKQSGRE